MPSEARKHHRKKDFGIFLLDSQTARCFGWAR